MIKVLLALYFILVILYGIKEYLIDPKLDKVKLLKRLGMGFLFGTLAVSILSLFVFLF